MGRARPGTPAAKAPPALSQAILKIACAVPEVIVWAEHCRALPRQMRGHETGEDVDVVGDDDTPFSLARSQATKPNKSAWTLVENESRDRDADGHLSGPRVNIEQVPRLPTFPARWARVGPRQRTSLVFELCPGSGLERPIALSRR